MIRKEELNNMSTDLYEIGGDYGNFAAKATRTGQAVVIRNVAARYNGDDDEFRSLEDSAAVSNRPGEIPTESERFIFGNQQWIVGDLAYEMSLRAHSPTSYARYGTDEWYALIAASFLKLYGDRSGTVALTFSMPVSQFRAEVPDENGNLVKQPRRIKELLCGTWEVERQGKRRTYEVVPEFLDIIPEGVGLLSYLCLDPSGKRFVDRELANSRVIVFDFGGYTLDVLTFNELNLGAFNESIETGLINVRNTIDRELKRRYNRSTPVPPKTLDAIISTGKYKHAGGKPEIVTDIVEGALTGLMKDALRIWQEDLGSGVDYDTVIIGGGGGPILGPMLQSQLGHNDVRILPEGEAHLANALGALYRRKYVREMKARKAVQAAG
jgi:hypothetical protein